MITYPKHAGIYCNIGTVLTTFWSADVNLASFKIFRLRYATINLRESYRDKMLCFLSIQHTELHIDFSFYLEIKKNLYPLKRKFINFNFLN